MHMWNARYIAITLALATCRGVWCVCVFSLIGEHIYIRVGGRWEFGGAFDACQMCSIVNGTHCIQYNTITVARQCLRSERRDTTLLGESRFAMMTVALLPTEFEQKNARFILKINMLDYKKSLFLF